MKAAWIISAMAVLCLAESVAAAGYWALEIPLADGATDVARSKNPALSRVAVDYQIRTDKPDSILALYKAFFESQGWVDPREEMKKLRDASQVGAGAWSSYRLNFDGEGQPRAHYTNAWAAPGIDAQATLEVTATGYESGRYTCAVSVNLVPQLEAIELFRLQKLVTRDTKNLFILHGAIGSNPLEVYSVDFERVLAIESSDPVIAEYVESIRRIHAGIQAFHKMHNE